MENKPYSGEQLYICMTTDIFCRHHDPKMCTHLFPHIRNVVCRIQEAQTVTTNCSCQPVPTAVEEADEILNGK